MKLDKKIDVLFFGKINKDRKDYINFLENNGLKVKIVGNNVENYVTDEESSENDKCKSKLLLILLKQHGKN